VTQERDAQALSGGRRAALRWLTRGFLSLWGLGAAAVGLTFLRAPTSEKRPGEGVVRGGTLSSLPIGQARFVAHGAEPLFLVRASETEVIALSAICTHLRCTLNWDETNGRIVCPCHAGTFDRSGNVISGPAKRPLPQYRVEVRDDEIRVRT
jgi:cytochrome b6-f complex iron-sulfur subunit